jgi:hypothetical protein
VRPPPGAAHLPPDGRLQVTLQLFPLAALCGESLQLAQLWQQLLEQLRDPEEAYPLEAVVSQQDMQARMAEMERQVGAPRVAPSQAGCRR